MFPFGSVSLIYTEIILFHYTNEENEPISMTHLTKLHDKVHRSVFDMPLLSLI